MSKITREQAWAFRRLIEKAAATQTDEDALQSIELFPAWESKIGQVLNVGERYSFGGYLYKVLQQHTAQSDWRPDVAVSLFVRVSVELWPEWVQPTGAQDAYMQGDKVSHNGKHWISNINGNVWEPGSIGTESLWTEQQ